MTYWTTQHFKAMQQAWYQRLNDAGFEDAEELVDGDMVLRQKAEHAICGLEEVELQSREAYYRFIAHMTQETAFKREVDRIIMASHASGMKITRICEELCKIGHPRGRQTVRYRIRIYEMKWGLKSYTKKQLNRRTA